MSIKAEFGKYVPTCDMCEDTLPPEENYLFAVDAKEAAGWIQVPSPNRFCKLDLCPICQTEKDKATYGKKKQG